MAERGAKMPFSLFPSHGLTFKRLADCSVNVCHIEDQVSDCGWLDTNPDLHFRRHKVAGADSKPRVH